MRYIRSKDNIYDERKLYNYCGVYYKESLRIGRPVASADTLEELIDVYILENGSTIQTYENNRENLLDILKDCNDNFTIYGTIRVSGKKGEPILKTIAIYKNGKLELL